MSSRKRQPVSYNLSKAYLFSVKAYWYWVIIALAGGNLLCVFAIPENAFPIVYLRYLLGSIFVLFLPGYGFIKALFPEKDINIIERIVLSIGSSIVIIPALSYVFNWTSWGIQTTSFTLTLFFLIVVFATVALYRGSPAFLKNNPQVSTR